jgi:hypothetical protein
MKSMFSRQSTFAATLVKASCSMTERGQSVINIEELDDTLSRKFAIVTVNMRITAQNSAEF